MYKILNIDQANAINLAFANKENNPLVTYSAIDKCATTDEHIIPVNEQLRLLLSPEWYATETDRLACSFITEQWLTETVAQKPEGWDWADLKKNNRVTVPNMLLFTDLYQFLMYVKLQEYVTVVNDNFTIIYYNYIIPEYITQLNNYQEIKFETLQ